MYQILINGKTLYYPGDAINAVAKAELEMALNDAGALSVTVQASNPEYYNIQERKTEFSILKNDVEIWSGEVRESNFDIKKNKKLYVVGELAYLADSIQPQARFQDASPEEFFRTLIDIHNSQVEDRKKFTVGVVTVTDPNDSIYRYTNRENTLDCIREKLCDSLGGYLRIRKENGIRYIDLVRMQDYGKTCQQPIKFGKNLLKFAKNITANDIATCVIPLGAMLETSPIDGLEAYTDITSVNSGKDYIESEEAVKNFGYIKKVVRFDDITEPANLKNAGEKWLEENQFAKIGITVDAVDLSEMNADIDTYELGDYVNVKASPFGMNAWYYLQERKINLLNVKKNTISVGDVTNKSYTKKMNSEMKAVVSDLPTKSTILASAQNNSSNLIKLATNGYIYLVNNAEGRPMELLIMDTPDITTAQKVWRWNVNGLGYSSTGYNGTYGTAITMDGKIVADYITTGTMQADRIKGGILKLGGSGNGNGAAQIVDASGKVLVTLDNKGITLADGVKIAWSNISGTETVLTKDTLKTESLEASNLKITGGSVNIKTASASENKIVLTYGNAKIYLAPAYVAVETETDRMEVSATGFMHSTKEGDTWYSRNYMSNYQFLIEQVIFKNDSDNCGNIKASGNEVVYTANNLHHFYGNTEFNDVVYLIKGGYLQYSTPITSDREVKIDLGELDEDKITKFIYSLKPVQFAYKNDEKQGIHHGLYAQDVKEAMGNEEWELYVDNSQNEEAPEQFRHLALRYEELIADLITTVQSQNKRIAILEDKLKEGA